MSHRSATPEDKLFASDSDPEGTKVMAGAVASWCAYLATWPEGRSRTHRNDAGLVEPARRAVPTARMGSFVHATLGEKGQVTTGL